MEIEKLEMLRKGKMTAGDIADKFNITNASVSYHLSYLKKADSVKEEKYKTYIYYELNTSVFEEILVWIYQFKNEDKEGDKMIEIKNVSKSYVKGKKSVEDLNLEIKNGEIFGFLGPNGAGKTTTIRMITGILNIDEGDILIDGKSIKKEPLEAKKNFGFVPDSPDMFLKLKGIEYLMFMADVYDVPQNKRKEKIEELTKKFGIYNELNSQIQSYSHGMRQKIVICGALLSEPKNWILDEPMTGLDPKSSYDLKEMMKEHAKSGKTVFFSTHILEVAEKLCNRVGIINKGKLVFVGTFDEMKQKFKENASLEDLFLEITEK